MRRNKQHGLNYLQNVTPCCVSLSAAVSMIFERIDTAKWTCLKLFLLQFDEISFSYFLSVGSIRIRINIDLIRCCCKYSLENFIFFIFLREHIWSLPIEKRLYMRTIYKVIFAINTSKWSWLSQYFNLITTEKL